MRPVRIYLAAAGPSVWVPIDYLESAFAIGFRCTVQDSSNLTYKVQHGFADGFQEANGIKMTRSTTTATVTFPVTTANPTHGLSLSDCIMTEGWGAPFDGVFEIASIPTSLTITFTVPNSGLTASTAGNLQKVFVGDNSVVTSETASVDGNYAFPPNMIRLYCTAYTSGAVTLSMNQGTGV